MFHLEVGVYREDFYALITHEYSKSNEYQFDSSKNGHWLESDWY